MRTIIFYVWVFLISVGLSACRHGKRARNEKTEMPAAHEVLQKKSSVTPKTNTSSVRKPSSTVPSQTGTKEKITETPALTSASATAGNIIRVDDIPLQLRLPQNFRPAGKTIKAYDRNGHILNKEAIFVDAEGNQLRIKWYHPKNAQAIWKFYENQFMSRKGNFALKAEKLNVDGATALYGISLRNFDGKGHPLNPPAKVYFAVWKKDNGLFEIYYRHRNGNQDREAFFLQLLKTVSTHEG